MTNREFLTAVSTNAITDEVIAHATEAIAKMDAANEARKNKTKLSPKEQEKASADAKIRESIYNLITEEPQTASELGAQVGVSTPKATAELRKLVAEGLVSKTDIKVPKKGIVKGYFLTPAEA